MPEPDPQPGPLGCIQPEATHTAQGSESSVAVGVLAVLGGVLIHLAC